MKSQVMFFLAVIIISGLAYSQNITVTSPHTGDKWQKGREYTISWTASGCADPNIKINIFKNSIDPANFVEQLTCTGCSSKKWKVPAGWNAGIYVIRVKTADNVCIGDSGEFQIESGLVPSTSCIPFKVYEPSENSTFWIGLSEIPVKWKNDVLLKAVPPGAPSATADSLKTGKMVRIEVKSVMCLNLPALQKELETMLLRKDVGQKEIDRVLKTPWSTDILQWKLIAITPDDGSYTWAVPPTFKKGCYRIRITREWCDAGDTERTALSGSFKLILVNLNIPDPIKK